jgi:hypothetical protein
MSYLLYLLFTFSIVRADRGVVVVLLHSAPPLSIGDRRKACQRHLKGIWERAGYLLA